MRAWIRGLSALTAVTLAGSIGLLLLFASGQTQFFLLLGLSDPSHPDPVLITRGVLERGTMAGYWCGLFISAVLAVATGLTGWVFLRWVRPDAAALEEAERLWEEGRVELACDRLQADDVVARLRDGVPEGTRLGEVLAAWAGPGRRDDALSRIEARATVPRQVLGYVVTIASALVLVGLVGNFFGLAEAVRRIPDLRSPDRPSVSSRTRPPASGTETDVIPLGSRRTVTRLSTYDRSQDEAPGAPAPGGNDRSGSLLSMISAGLSVVVVSSVMGIGAMLVLLLLAAAVRGTLNSLVAREMDLVGGRLAPHLCPGPVDRLASSLAVFSSLPGSLETIDASSRSFATAMQAGDAHIQAVAGSMGQLVRHQLVDAREAYDRYHASLTSFSGVLDEQRSVMATLAVSSAQVAEGLTGVSREVARLAEASRVVHQSYRDAHLEYEHYLRASLQRAEAQHELMQATCRELTSTAGQEAREATRTHQRVLDENARRVADILKGELEQWGSAHRASLGVVEGAVTTSAAGAGDAIREACAALAEVRGSFQKVYERTTASFDACLQEILDETRAGLHEIHASSATVGEEARATIEEAAKTLGDVRRKFHQVYDRVTTSFEQATVSLLELHEETCGRLGQAQGAAFTEALRRLAEHGERQEALLASVAQVRDREVRAADRRERARDGLGERLERLVATLEAGASADRRTSEALVQRLEAALERHAEVLREAAGESARNREGLEATVIRLVDGVDRLAALQEPGLAESALPIAEGSEPGGGEPKETRGSGGSGARRPFFRQLVAERQSGGRAEGDVDGLGGA